MAPIAIGLVAVGFLSVGLVAVGLLAVGLLPVGFFTNSGPRPWRFWRRRFYLRWFWEDD